MDRDRTTGAFVLVYRYATSPKNARRLETLRQTIVWLLHIEEWDPEPECVRPPPVLGRRSSY